MVTEEYIFLALLVIAAAIVIRRLRQTFRFHGEMIVTCPETLKPAAVKVDLARAAAGFITGHMTLRLSDCSRWPERAGCDQDCVVQLERDPKNHRVWTIASHWFEGKKCVYCKKPIEPLHHLDRRPAVMGQEKITTQWDEIPAEKLPETFSSARPVCWSCHMTETFIREHPDLVVTRPWKKSGPLGEYVPEKGAAASDVHHNAA